MSRRAFRNASQASQTLAPQGVLSKLGETINVRFRNATSSAGGGVAAPAALEGSGGVSANATRGDAEDTPISARAFSPNLLTNLVGGLREGRGASQTSATSNSPLSSSSRSSPPLSERAVKGVLGGVFTSKGTAKERGDDGGGGAQATAADREGSAVARSAASKKKGKSHIEEETKMLSVDPNATTASGDDRSGGVFGRFGRLGQGSGRTKSPAPSVTPGPAKEPRQDNSGRTRGGDKTKRERRGAPAKKADSNGGVPAARATAGVAARSSTPVVASTAAPSARPKVERPPRPAPAAGSATNTSGNAKKQGDDALRATDKAVRPDSKRRRGSRDVTKEGQRWPDVDVAAAGSSTDNNLIGKIRVPWATTRSSKINEQRGPRGDQQEEESGGKVDTDGGGADSSSGGEGSGVVARMRGWFGGRHEGGGGGSGSDGNVSGDPLDEIGLGG